MLSISPDTFNGCFEIVCAIMLILDVRVLLHHKSVKGISVISRLFFWAWSCWNLWWYWHLGQWISWGGAMMVIIPQTAWMALLLIYKYRDLRDH